MLQNIDLRELSQLSGNGRDVLTVYFRGKEGLSKLTERMRTIRDLLDDDLEIENFEASLSNLKALLDESDVSEATCVCGISSDVLDVCRLYPFSLEVADGMFYGPAPYIRPLAELQDEYETFLIVTCDNERTRIFSVTNESAEVETAIKGGIKNHVRKGGWSQQRYERRRDNELGHYGDEVAEELENLIQHLNVQRIVLAGSEETMRAIEHQMSDRFREMIVGREAFDLNRSQDELLEKAYDSYFARERSEEQDLWQQIQDETLSGGRGCLGKIETLRAAEHGRVDTAIATRDLQTEVSQCRACGNVAAFVVPTCPDCGSDDIFAMDYIDTLARQLELTGAVLNFVDEIKPLTKVGHVAALLRY